MNTLPHGGQVSRGEWPTQQPVGQAAYQLQLDVQELALTILKC